LEYQLHCGAILQSNNRAASIRPSNFTKASTLKGSWRMWICWLKNMKRRKMR